LIFRSEVYRLASCHLSQTEAGLFLKIRPSPSGKPGVGTGIPVSVAGIKGFGSIDVPVSDVSSIGRPGHVRMLVLTEHMPDGTFMVVGRESYPLEALRSVLNRIALWGSICLMLLAVFAGLVTGLLFLRRLELVNATTGRIMDGNLSERLPSIGFGQEFHDLTRNLNVMLDRLETAMASMRQVSTDVAHDLRMPLTRLKNRLEEIEPASRAQAAQIEGAMEEMDELLLLFNAMLRIARLEAGGTPHSLAMIDLSALAEQLACPIMRVHRTS
jgi:signal transduction histidine kinase